MNRVRSMAMIPAVDIPSKYMCTPFSSSIFIERRYHNHLQSERQFKTFLILTSPRHHLRRIELKHVSAMLCQKWPADFSPGITSLASDDCVLTMAHGGGVSGMPQNGEHASFPPKVLRLRAVRLHVYNRDMHGKSPQHGKARNPPRTLSLPPNSLSCRHIARPQTHTQTHRLAPGWYHLDGQILQVRA